MDGYNPLGWLAELDSDAAELDGAMTTIAALRADNARLRTELDGAKGALLIEIQMRPDWAEAMRAKCEAICRAIAEPPQTGWYEDSSGADDCAEAIAALKADGPGGL